MTVEVSWFSALCDDDYEFLGQEDAELKSSWDHCRNIVMTADRYGFDNVLLPSGYALGIDNTAFAAAVAPLAQHIRRLLRFQRRDPGAMTKLCQAFAGDLQQPVHRAVGAAGPRGSDDQRATGLARGLDQALPFDLGRAARIFRYPPSKV